jgi:NitT/TauT family transport system substrate-binding protein
MHSGRVSRRDVLRVALAACAGYVAPSVGVAAEPRKMTVMADYYGALFNTSIVAAGLEKGFYNKPEVQVAEIVTGGGGGTAVRNMIGGNIDYGIISTSAALSAIKEGVDIKVVHGAIRTMEDLFWVSMPNSGIKSIQDLKGKKIGFTRPRSISETMAKWKLRKAGMEGQAQLVSLGAVGAGLSALESGGVDAALILEPLWSSRKGRYQVAFNLAELPPMSQMVGCAGGKLMQEQPEVLRALIQAWRQTVDFTYANGEETARIIAKKWPQLVAPDVAESAIKSLQGVKYWSRGDIDIAGLGFWVDAMKEQGELVGAVDLKGMINESFLPPDLRRS